MSTDHTASRTPNSIHSGVSESEHERNRMLSEKPDSQPRSTAVGLYKGALGASTWVD